jgi:hypothetical protein
MADYFLLADHVLRMHVSPNANYMYGAPLPLIVLDLMMIMFFNT